MLILAQFRNTMAVKFITEDVNHLGKKTITLLLISILFSLSNWSIYVTELLFLIYIVYWPLKVKYDK